MSERRYLFEARSPQGKAKAGFVDAASVADARERLSAQGFSDVIVQDDDFLSDLREKGKDPKLEQDADLEAMSRREPSVLALVAYVVRANFWIYVGALALLALAAFRGWPWWLNMLAGAAIAVAAWLAAFPAWIGWQSNELYRRFWAGDWDGAEAVAVRLRGMRMLADSHGVLFELDGRIAASRLMKGDVEGAFARVRPWEHSPHIPKVAYFGKVGILHYLARDWDAVIRNHELALAADPASDTAKIDLALMYARIAMDAERAEALLDGIDPAQVVPMQAAFMVWCRGFIALLRRRDDEALRLLADANQRLQQWAANPVSWGVVALAVAALCVAMARNGRRAQAQEMFANVRSLAVRHGEEPLLGWLREEGLIEAR